MTSKIKVDNINKVSDDSNIINKCGTSITVGTGSDTTTVPGAATVTGDLKSDSLKAADGGVIISQSGTTITLGASGDTISLASGASQTGFGRTGTVDWQTGSIKTATFTAANGEGYFADTSSGAFTMNLPAGTAGNIVSVVDYTNTFQTNNLTIAPNGSQKIGGTAASHALNTEGQSITLVYVDDTEGWKNVQDSTSNITGSVPYIAASGGTESTSGDCKIHVFTGPGTFSVTAASTIPANNVFKYLVVGGGGGGRAQNGSARGGGAGGAGGYRSSSFGPSPLQGTDLTGSVASFPIAVGGGGAGAVLPNTSAVAGAVSTFSTITSTGGGLGGGMDPQQPGTPGGSGGGGGDSGGVGTTYPGGTGNTPPVSPPQGNNGGSAGGNPNNNGGGGGGGGGAGGAGSSGQPSGPSYPRNGGSGGSGVPNSITGSGVTYSAGGTGGPTANQTGGAGTANTGNGANGGGGGHPGHSPSNGAAGGSGIVVIRYKYQN
jgi:hypothetical protein